MTSGFAALENRDPILSGVHSVAFDTLSLTAIFGRTSVEIYTIVVPFLAG